MEKKEKSFREKMIECDKLKYKIYHGDLKPFTCRATNKECSAKNCPIK